MKWRLDVRILSAFTDILFIGKSIRQNHYNPELRYRINLAAVKSGLASLVGECCRCDGAARVSNQQRTVSLSHKMNEHVSDRDWIFPGFNWKPADRPRLMGILNVTPDSFSDGGRYSEIKSAVDHALALISEGADILDVGGESTRPGAAPVTLEDELRRTIPVIEAIVSKTSVPISIDTYKAEVARQALLAGAKIVNDISGLTFDDKMVNVCVDHPCGVICMHIRGTPQTMQNDPRYENVVEDLFRHFSTRINELERAGLPRERIVIDPGVGFGKTAEHNVEILSHIARLHELGRPVLIGHSRKRFLQKVLGKPLDERSSGTVGVSIALAQQGVDILRVHDVAATKDAIAAWKAILPAATA